MDQTKAPAPDSGPFYHGTRADLKPGDLIAPGFNSNYGSRKKASFVYLTATLDAAIWGAELAQGEGPGRIYLVEPTGPIEDDPNSGKWVLRLLSNLHPSNKKTFRYENTLRCPRPVVQCMLRPAGPN